MRIAAFLIALVLTSSTFAQDTAATKPSDAVDPANWQQRFEQTYNLKDDEILKRIPPPFIAARGEYYRAKHADQARAIPKGPDYFAFTFDGMVHVRSLGFGFSGGLTIAQVLDTVLRLKTYEFDGPKELLGVKLPGDWVVRTTAETSDLLPALANIVNSASPRQIQFEQQEVKRKVIIASGEYAFHPLPGPRNPLVHVYIDSREERESNGTGSGTLDKFLAAVGSRVNVPIIDEVQGKRPGPINWEIYSSSLLSDLPDGDKKTEKLQKVLDNLSDQTSLQFSIDDREVQVWMVSEKPAGKP